MLRLSGWCPRHLGTHWWDDAVQATISATIDEPWQVIAQDREAWHRLEAYFNARVTRMALARADLLLRGRHMIAESSPAA